MTERVLPRQFPTVPPYMIPLSNDELTELGTFAAVWSQIDFILMLAISNLSGTAPAQLLLMTDTMTTGPRVNLLTKLCQQNSTDVTRRIKALCDRHNGLIEDRNHIIHGLWAIKWDYATNATGPASLYQKGNRNPTPATKLRTLSDRAAEFGHELAGLLAELDPMLVSGMPRPFFFGAGAPPDREPPPWPPKQSG